MKDATIAEFNLMIAFKKYYLILIIIFRQLNYYSIIVIYFLEMIKEIDITREIPKYVTLMNCMKHAQCLLKYLNIYDKCS